MCKEESLSRQPSDMRVLCAMRIKNEAEHIHQVLSQALVLCQRAFIFDDHSTDETVAICQSFGSQVRVIESPFNDFNEARDKNFLLKKIIEADPEWVLWIDGDEVLERSGPEKLKYTIDNTRGIVAYSLHISYVWNDPQHIRVDGIFGRFNRLSLFRLKDQNVKQLYFPAGRATTGFHCGNVPKGLVGKTKELNVRLKHFGYMSKEKRRTKYEWYTTMDPNNRAEDNYRHLAEVRGARFAPGPPQILPWIE
ncbi:MAG: glycosyltransferase [bacterium]